MNGGKSAGGFTIVEVLIYMAVTAALFSVAFVFISGKQAATEFSQATRDFQSQIEDKINDVSGGFYPSTTNFPCTISGNAPDFSSGGNEQQGGHEDCLFTGKVIQLIGGADSFKIFTTAGLRQTTSAPTTDVTSLKDAHIRTYTGQVDNGNLAYGLTVTCVYFGATACTNLNSLGAIGFFSTFNYNSGNPTTGSTDTDIIPVPTTSLTDSQAQLVAAVNGKIGGWAPGLTVNPQPVVICLKGGNDKPAALILNGAGGQITTTLVIGRYMVNGSCPP